MDLKQITIRKIGSGDLEELQAVSKRTFQEAFAQGNTSANMVKYVEEAFNTERLFAELADQDSHFYFAEMNDHAVGYLKVNAGHAQTEKFDENALEIERIYVLQEFHGRKVGQLLYDKAIEIARARNASHLWLGVWEKNPRAIAFYRKNGFVEFGKHVFRLGDDEQTDVLMRQIL